LIVEETYDPHADLGVPPPPGYRSIRQREAARAGTRRIVIVAGVLGVGLVTAGAALEYASHRSHAIPVIEADSRPLRVKPENPGGMQIAGVGESILSGQTAAATPESLAPPPETPDPNGLRQQEQAIRAREAAQAAVKQNDAAQALNKAGVVALNVPQPPNAEDTSSAANAAPALEQAPPAPAAPARIAHPPAPKPTKVASAAPVAAPVAAPRPSVTAKPAPAIGAHEVQLAAVSTEAAAAAEWQRLSHMLPDLLGGRSPAVSQYTRDGHVFWRLRTGGFADAAEANFFCTEVRAKGLNCTPASF
jgi:hypothetical protein